ncbi:hypothetical protein ACFPZL_01655 [Leucobacter soli]|uniref:Uncharacterized protein n=1 Tax=Leucobacter soli TaxID=2812850 RepID=A0A916NMX8_9MICO|nr:hypothetical protein [Leucobacter soli]CAG7603892.1 hypothetical protein LEUCIP111803_00682 [Leucobacter soli]
MRLQRRTSTAATLISGAVVLLLAACSGSAPSEEPVAPDPEPTETETIEDAFAIEDFDFANADWSVVPFAETWPAVEFTAVDGAVEVDGIAYTVIADEIEFSDADGDGALDAIVPVEGYGGGNSVDRQWYIWATRDGTAVQVPLPVARSIHCGTLTKSVEPVDGGFRVHEFRRAIGESDYLACTDIGSDERTRIVGIAEADGELWPVQLEPVRAYGGICPVAAEYDAYPTDLDFLPLPHAEAEALRAESGQGMTEFAVEDWPVYLEVRPGWLLRGIIVDSTMACAWLPTG